MSNILELNSERYIGQVRVNVDIRPKSFTIVKSKVDGSLVSLARPEDFDARVHERVVDKPVEAEKVVAPPAAESPVDVAAPVVELTEEEAKEKKLYHALRFKGSKRSEEETKAYALLKAKYAKKD